MKSESKKNLSLLILAIAFIAFIYGTIKAMAIVERTHVGTSDGIYRSYVTTSQEIKEKAFALTEHCRDAHCKVQSLLDFVTNIPYRTNTFQQYSAQKTIMQNFGDCDDKSNLLISMLHALGLEAYFVLVPKHIFVITAIEDERLDQRKGLWVNGKKYFILESTARNSNIGFPLHYRLDELDVIVEPFSNKKLSIEKLEWKE
ncbi:transglutaminase-like domain-containing protein [Sulfurovum sp. XGS-02]|uniref:transglutaminase-like domain-containing protein n=1 Tax=Sulfurovum sp. XGS-02 TaxID=2925411 RepID=UPI00205459A4|nr:transglutaminase-like domain-containing protein [Sulfurovum sp. XGS-02]UPT77121.1 transglutaminase-like domain-containing protein [Sulfurovum sp. XGS-02]